MPSVRIESAKVKHVTEHALKISYEGKRYWVPISLIDNADSRIEDLEDGDEFDFSLPEWFALKEGMI